MLFRSLKNLGFNFEFVKKVSIIHYFKQLRALNIDVLFIPLIKNIYNITSENYNKYLEAALLNIPVLTININPYNKLIQNKLNGFLFNETNDFFRSVEILILDKTMIKQAGTAAN